MKESSGPSGDKPQDRPRSYFDGGADILKPDGSVVPFSTFMAERRAEGEPEMLTSALGVGDIVHIESAEPESNVTFEVKKEAWKNLEDDASKVLMGRVYGQDVPPDAEGKDVVFIGSGLGLSYLQPDRLTTSAFAEFQVIGDGVYHGPEVSGFQVFRPTEDGKLQEVAFNREERVNPAVRAAHETKLNTVEQISNGMGFSIKDFTIERDIFDIRDNRTDIDDRYLIDYSDDGRAMGNSFGALDLVTKQWVRVDYRNWDGSDMLKVSTADLSEGGIGLDVNSLSAVHRAGVPITTYVTSGRSSLDTVNYSFGQADKQEYFGDTYTPPFVLLWPNGEMGVDTRCWLGSSEQKEMEARVRDIVKYSIGEEGRKLLRIGENTHVIPDPHPILADLHARLHK